VAKITERNYQLLTAYVDGELSVRQRRMVLRLLRRSADARSLLHHLQKDSRELKSLTRHQLPKDFPQRVLQTLSLKEMTRPLVLPMARPRAIPAWVTYAAAAVLLIGVGAVAFEFFTKVMSPSHQSGTVVEKKSDGSGDANLDGSSSEPNPDSAKSSEESPPVERGHIDLALELKKLQPDPPLTELTEDAMSKLFGSATTDRKIKDFAATKEADVIHPIIRVGGVNVAEILPKLKQERSVRIDFPCKDGTAACERLKAVVAASGINPIIEQVADYRLKHPKLDTNYVMYLEDVTADELAKILETVGRADSGKSAEPLFGGLVLARMTETDATELKGLLGSYGRFLRLRLGSGSASAPLDPKTSLPTTTPDEIFLAPPRPDSSKSSAKAERQGLILPYNPVRPQQRSAEVKRFIETRRQPRPETLQVLLVVHDVVQK